MARSTKAKTPKGRNGVGDSLTVYFDCSDPAERKALEAARLLATKHGRRKQAIIALLEAVYNHYERTGELISSSEISAALMSQTAPAGDHPVGFMPSANSQVHERETPSSRRQQQHTGGVEITSRTSSAERVAQNFLQSVSGLASGFFD